MPIVPLVALKPTRYDGKLVRKGQSFDALSESDATVLTLANLARYADTSKNAQPEPLPWLAPTTAPAAPVHELPTTHSEPSAEPQPEVVVQIDQQAVQQSVADVIKDAPTPRRYRRKDMAAEE